MIGLSTVPEAASYYILDKLVMVIFPILTMILFGALLVLKAKAWFKKIASLIYLGLAILQVLVWAFLIYQTFYVDFDGRKTCEDDGKIDDDGWMFDGTLYEDFDDCYAE